MERIILKDNEKDRFVFNISQLMIDLQRLTDSRKARGKRYKLPHILIFILLAKLAGEDTPKGIAEWIKLRRRQLVSSFKIERDSVSAYNTIRRTLANVVKEDELQEIFRLFLHWQYGGHKRFWLH
ncbi:MAG: transposase family protein [Ardenticatenaceae bacterium]|nr:transposase family protein [Anaerolineales bacterium]MCB8923819.1 transposase family protein [Ardenticatenaceae bacterium]MCB9003402.1 transposase family protein [Ardenticatenaceae bacterium]